MKQLLPFLGLLLALTARAVIWTGPNEPGSGGGGGGGPSASTVINMIRTNLSGQTTIYVNGATGDDANTGTHDQPLKTIEQATTNSVAGQYTLIEVLPTDYWPTNGIRLKVGNHLRAYGATIHNLATNLANLHVFGIVSRENTIVEGTFVTNHFKDSFYQVCYGSHHLLNWGTLSNAWWIKTTGRGDSDCWFSKMTNNISLGFIDPSFEGKFDSWVAVNESGWAPHVQLYWRGGASYIVTNSTFNPAFGYTHAFGFDGVGSGMSVDAVLEDVTLASTNNNRNQWFNCVSRPTGAVNVTFRNCTLIGGNTGLGDPMQETGSLTFDGSTLRNVAGSVETMLNNYVSGYDGDPNPPLVFRNSRWVNSSGTIKDIVYGTEPRSSTPKSYVVGFLEVTDDAYNDTSWNGNLTVPTKNAVRDAYPAVVAGDNVTVDVATDGTTGKKTFTVNSSGGGGGSATLKHVNTTTVTMPAVFTQFDVIDATTTIAGNSLVAGNVIFWELSGTYTDPDVDQPQMVFDFQYGAVPVSIATITIPNTYGSGNWTVKGTTTFRDADNDSTAVTTLQTTLIGSDADVPVQQFITTQITPSLDTTASCNLHVNAQYGTSSPGNWSMDCTQLVIDLRAP